uniref:ribosomal protein L35 n=1 Tax=Lithothamnion corallioides TaxID=1277934 RepID=UPI0023F0B268|nr:ribosomal protein L35 [Lithothamnion corallioides]WEA77067.1 ribosomal protein L35 [Lithothamnion corallioides]
MSNYKLKSSSSILKRLKITRTGKLLRRKACRSHLLQKKSSKHKQKLRKVVEVKYVDVSRLALSVL